jgi:hypothetical protein
VVRLSSRSGESRWGDFPRTVLHFDSAPVFALDLQQPVGATELAGLKRIGFERPFGVVTAQDPMGIAQTADSNAALAARLLAEVAALGAPHVCVDACSPDRSHCERSIALVHDLQVLVDLARRYSQLAIFWFDGAAFWIVPACSSREERVRLPASAS